MVICKFYQSGNCRFGTKCANEHFDVKPLIKSEVEAALKGSQWPLSCFGPFKEKPCLPNFIEDQSFEEIRHLSYEARKQNFFPQFQQQFNSQIVDAQNKMKTLLTLNREIIDLVTSIYDSSLDTSGQQKQVSNANPFSTNSSNIFDNSQQINPFAKPNSEIKPGGFGNVNGSSIFGGGSDTQNNAVLGQTAFGNNNNNNVFGTQQTSIFSAPNQQQNNFGGFGGQTQSSNIFAQQSGQQQQQQSTAHSIFGGNNQMQQQQPQSFGGANNMFGAQANAFNQQAPTSNIFSQPPQQQTVFGGFAQNQQQIQPAGGIFENQPAMQQPNVFGAQSQVQQTTQNVFSQQPLQQAQTASLQNQLPQQQSVFGVNQQQQQPQLQQQTQNFNQINSAENMQSQNVFGQQAVAQQSMSQQQQQLFQKTQPQISGQIRNGIYSKMEELSAQDIEAFKASHFSLENLPCVPPPRELC